MRFLLGLICSIGFSSIAMAQAVTVNLNNAPVGAANPFFVQETPAYGTPTPTTVAMTGASVSVGSPSSTAHYINIQIQGSAPVCLTFGTGTLTAPTGTGNSGYCAVGFYLQPSQSVKYTAADGAVPSSQLKAFGATGAYVLEEVQ